jgi:hypothetical protein
MPTTPDAGATGRWTLWEHELNAARPTTTQESKSRRPMAQVVIPLGAVPARESSAQVGEIGYAERAVLECRRYMALLRDVIGPEPEGARLLVRRSAPDFGSYLEVVVEYDDENKVARAYAIRCDREAPTTWE